MEFQAVLKHCEGKLIKTLRNKEESAVLLMERSDGQRFVLRVYNRSVWAYQAMTAHDCPFLPQITGCIEKEGFFVVEEEWIDGVSLQEMLDGGTRLTPSRAATLVSDICTALSTLHQAGFIHRDVKPEHVLVTAEGRVVLIDLDASMEVRPEKENDTRLLGTVTYAAPEQFGLSRSDVRTDVYSVGILLNMVLTGAHPAVVKYKGGNLEQVIERCIRMNPQDRFQSAAEVKDALKQAVKDALKRAAKDAVEMEPDDEPKPDDGKKPGRGIFLKKRGVALAAALCMLLLVVGIALPTTGFLGETSPEGGEGGTIPVSQEDGGEPQTYRRIVFCDKPLGDNITVEELGNFDLQQNFPMSGTEANSVQKYVYIGTYQETKEAGWTFDTYIDAKPFNEGVEAFVVQLLIRDTEQGPICGSKAGMEIEQVEEGKNLYKFTLDRSANGYLASGKVVMGFDITLPGRSMGNGFITLTEEEPVAADLTLKATSEETEYTTKDMIEKGFFDVPVTACYKGSLLDGTEYEAAFYDENFGKVIKDENGFFKIESQAEGIRELVITYKNKEYSFLIETN